MLNTQVCTLFGAAAAVAAAAAAAAAVTRMPNLIGFSRRKSRLSSLLTNCMHPLTVWTALPAAAAYFTFSRNYRTFSKLQRQSFEVWQIRIIYWNGFYNSFCSLP